jgi:hypothetical protein
MLVIKVLNNVDVIASHFLFAWYGTVLESSRPVLEGPKLVLGLEDRGLVLGLKGPGLALDGVALSPTLVWKEDCLLEAVHTQTLILNCLYQS